MLFLSKEMHRLFKFLIAARILSSADPLLATRLKISVLSSNSLSFSSVALLEDDDDVFVTKLAPFRRLRVDEPSQN